MFLEIQQTDDSSGERIAKQKDIEAEDEVTLNISRAYQSLNLMLMYVWYSAHWEFWQPHRRHKPVRQTHGMSEWRPKRLHWLCTATGSYADTDSAVYTTSKQYRAAASFVDLRKTLNSL